MVFSSSIFLFAFLPLTLLVYYLSPRFLKNLILLSASLAFYAWGELFYVLLMLVSIVINYAFGLRIRGSRWVLGSAISANLALLAHFKYINFVVDNVNAALAMASLEPILLEPVHLPLGISFFTFQALSYLIDVYRGETPAQKKPLDLALYISCFPQLIAGPIVRYHDVAQQISERRHSLELFSSGVQRFVFGLAKKLLIANPLGAVADSIFVLPADELSIALCWIAISCYTLQIYFDFSGYSDMAIGLGRMFGFRFLENFNYPYIAGSIRAFWQRWHISLSNWFRDYLYIPLGGSRVVGWHTYCNLLLVFFLCGLWHGASWSFVVWGLFHGFFLVMERSFLGRWLNCLWSPLRHVYVVLTVMVGWVFFRSDNLSYALDFLATLFTLRAHNDVSIHLPGFFLNNEAITVFVMGVVLSTPIYRQLNHLAKQRFANSLCFNYLPRLFLLAMLLFLILIKISADTYNPFIYFRF